MVVLYMKIGIRILSNSLELDNIQLVIINCIFVPPKSKKIKIPLLL
jgi:hypothetical protein